MVICVFICSCGEAWWPSWLRPTPEGAEGAAQSEQDVRPRGLIGVLLNDRFFASCLLFVPLGELAYGMRWHAWIVCLCNFLAMLSLAWLIGKSAQDVTATRDAMLGGLLNASCGNLVMVSLCAAGLHQRQVSMVQYMLLGSILSNMLLGLGICFLSGGFSFHTQKFSQSFGAVQSSLMLMSVLGTSLPTLFCTLNPQSEAIAPVSRGCSVLLLAMYPQYLFFQLRTHRAILEPEEFWYEDTVKVDLSPRVAYSVLFASVLLSLLSARAFMARVQEATEALKVSEEFIGVILLPLLANFAQLHSAINGAGKNKMDFAVGVAAGSASQVVLLLTPLTILLGAWLDIQVSMDLRPFQALVLLVSILLASSVLKDGESDWLRGCVLTTAYAMIVGSYFCKGL